MSLPEEAMPSMLSLINCFVNVLVCATYTPRSLWVFEHCSYYIM